MQRRDANIVHYLFIVVMFGSTAAIKYKDRSTPVDEIQDYSCKKMTIESFADSFLVMHDIVFDSRHYDNDNIILLSALVPIDWFVRSC